jgi:hypothetical protein
MFNTKYPTIAALIALFADAAKIATKPGENVGQIITGEIVELPAILAFLPQAIKLSAELLAIKSQPSDIISAAETLVSDLSFSNEKSKEIIDAVFDDAEYLANMIPEVIARAKKTIEVFQK